MENKAFRKGQAVTYFGNWDHKGTIRVADLTVYSCGAKKMILVDESGAQFEGRNFQPAQTAQGNGTFTEVHPRMTAADADAYALELGARVVASERARLEHAIESAPRSWEHVSGYIKAMRESIAALHEPRVYRSDNK